MDRDLFVEHLQRNTEAAAHLFADREGLRRVAMVMAGSTPRAIDYIRQAPVIVLLMHASLSRRRGYREDAPPVADDFFFSHARAPLSRIGEVSAHLFGAGHKLRHVMNVIWRGEAMGFQPLGRGEPTSLYQLRGLHAGALRHAYIGPVLLLANITPSTLAQILPRHVTYQRSWLAFLTGWHTRMHNRRDIVGRVDHSTVEGLAICTAPEKYGLGVYEGGHVADYMLVCRVSGGPPIQPGWTYADLNRAVYAWAQANPAASGVSRVRTPDAVADYTPLPNEPVTVGEYTFVPLRTAAALAEEGQAMRHCVANYVADIFARSSFIYSVRLEQQRIATLEIGATRGPLRMRQLEGPRRADGRRMLDLAPAVRKAVARFVILHGAPGLVPG